MTQINLGTIGSGKIVHCFLNNVMKIDGIRLSAVYSRRTETAKALAAEYGVNRFYSDIDALFSDEKVNTIYIATPNLLHYEQAKKALFAGKHVILEKPFTTKAKHAKELIEIAKERKLFLFDAVPTAFMPNFHALMRELPKIGKVKLVQSNYSQYSSRYDQLLAGELPNIFNPSYAGGCLMDINFYNIYMNIALFGKPLDAIYHPNMYHGIDTSGIAVLQYDGFVSECSGAKDTWGKNFLMIEGEQGYIYVEGGSSMSCIKVTTKFTEEEINEQSNTDRWFYEVQSITQMLMKADYQTAYQKLDVTLDVIETLEKMRINAGVLFPGD